MTSKGLEDAPRHTFGVGAYGLSGGVGKRKVLVGEVRLLRVKRELGEVFVGEIGCCWESGKKNKEK